MQSDATVAANDMNLILIANLHPFTQIVTPRANVLASSQTGSIGVRKIWGCHIGDWSS